MKKQNLRKQNLIFPKLLVLGVILFFLFSVKIIYSQVKEEPCPKPYIFSISPKAAKIGEKVKIRGNRFGKDKGSVTFSPKIQAPIKSWTYQRIIVKVPEEAETGPVFLTSSCGESSNEKYFIIIKEEEK